MPVAAFVAGLLLALSLAGRVAVAAEPAHVLVLLSYHHGHSWENDILRGFEAWEGASAERPVFHVEWMDTKRFPGTEYRQRYQQFLDAKYAERHFDLLVAVDDNALIQAVNSAPWRSVPIVFSGINGDPATIIGERGRATGIAERFRVGPTLDLALSLHPRTERLIFITAADESGAGNRNTINADLDRLPPPTRNRLVIDHWTPTSLASIESPLIGLPEHTLVFALGSIPRTEGGRPVGNEELVAYVRGKTRVPVYSDTDRSVGHGAVGGYVNSGLENGRMMASMARRILAGEVPESLPVVFATPQALLLDFNELKRFDLSTRGLPAEAQVLNRPATIFDPENRTILISFIAAILLLTLVLGGLVMRARLRILRVQNERARELQRANEALVQATAVAESASHAKSAFLANMSHELRTPMNGLMGMIDMALRRSQDPVLTDQLTKARTASLHLLHVINDILDISKIEADRLKLEHIDFPLGEILENLVSLTEHKANEKGLQLRIDLQAGLSAQYFNGDPMRLSQILLNLIGNALKFTERGSITLRCYSVQDNPDGALALLRWEIIDTGIGISDEDQKRLFSAFEQADSSMTRKYGGTGLGLAICKRLVELMGGHIGVDSTPGQGSTFWFVIPLQKRAGAANPVAPNLPAQTAEQRLQAEYAGTRVLLAEDEPINQEVSRSLLEEVGLSIDQADNGMEALALAQQNRYAVILMDVQMPHLNGLEATRAIRADSLNRHTPILAMTANAFEEDRQICLDAGMNDHVPKPVDPQILYETLLAWLGKCAER